MASPVLGGMLGLAVGDALGVPVEFSSRSKLKEHPVTSMMAFGTHQQPAGTWSDDSSLTFCLTDSLCNGYRLEEIAQLMIRWFCKEIWTPHGQVFDIGITTREAIMRVMRGVHPRLSGSRNVAENGNGSLMRILPLAFYFQKNTFEERHAKVHEVSAITHAHPRSLLACSIYVEFAVLLLDGRTPLQAYKEMNVRIKEWAVQVPDMAQELYLFERILGGGLPELPEEEMSGSGYVLHTVESALWCVLTSGDYRSTVLKAVHLGEDTDTTAAVAGGLAGIIYGSIGIPDEWLEVLVKIDDIAALAFRFERVVKERSTGTSTEQ